MAARFRTRRPLRWRVMSRFNPRNRKGLRTLDCSSRYTPRSMARGSPRPGREVDAVFEDRADPKPSYIMRLDWRDGRISLSMITAMSGMSPPRQI
jgi:hypothetical protein